MEVKNVCYLYQISAVIFITIPYNFITLLLLIFSNASRSLMITLMVCSCCNHPPPPPVSMKYDMKPKMKDINLVPGYSTT